MVWFDANYGYKKKITIDNTKVSGDETDFPVLISVIDNDLRDEANGGHVKSANGYDIIFTNNNEDTQLKHEIERYINTNGTLVYWVKVSSLSSTPPSTYIYIYYGKTGVGADPSTTDTWDANFLAVYHMDDAAGGADDSTGNHDATEGNAPIYHGAGQIGYGIDFEKDNDDYLNISNSNSLDPLASISVEAWVKLESETNGGIATKTTDAGYGHSPWDLRLYGGEMAISFSMNKSAGGNQEETARSAVINTGTWYYTAGTWTEGEKLNIYLDDAAANQSTNIFPTMSDYDTAIAKIAKRGTLASWEWDGLLDEIRISNTKRSANWIGTTYETQNDPAGFMSWGAEETESVVTGADIYYHNGTNNIELQRDDSSPVQMFNGVEIIGLKLGATNHADASPFHVFDGTTIKAILKMP